MIAAVRLRLDITATPGNPERSQRVIESGQRIPESVPSAVQQYLAASGWAVEEEIPGD